MFFHNFNHNSNSLYSANLQEFQFAAPQSTIIYIYAAFMLRFRSAMNRLRRSHR